jgi:apolipoprotein N-acyltransferase
MPTSTAPLDSRTTPAAPLPTDAHASWRTNRRWVGVFALAGLAMGLGHWPGLAPLTWLAVALYAWALRRPISARWLVAGLMAGALVRWLVGHPWHLSAGALYLPGGQLGAWLGALPISAAWVAPGVACLAVGALAARRWRLPVWLWLPAAWWLGDSAQDALWGLSYDTWMYAQWQVEPMLRAIGHLGWTPAMLLAVGTLAAFAEAVATRGRMAIAVAAFGAIAWLVMPPLPTSPATGASAFAGLGAVYMADQERPPRSAPPGVDLLLWPELAGRHSAQAREGAQAGAFVELPFRTAGVQHLYGLETRSAGGRQNSMVAASPTGEVLDVRAKTRLFPLTEQALGGLRMPGRATYRPGTAAPVVTVGGHRFGVLICLEALDRSLARQARAAGATMLVIPSCDKVLANDRLAMDQLMGAAVMRAVETGLPVVRAGMFGPSAFITAQGQILARSAPGADGVLTVGADHPEQPRTESTRPAPGTVAVLYSRHTPQMLPALPCDGCAGHAIEGFKPRGERAKTVILSGDSLPPAYLGRPAAEVAAAIASFKPELVVLDTCFGASTPLLDALAEAGVKAQVVAPAFRIPASGLVYDAGFLAEPDPIRRAAMVRTEPVFPLLRTAIAPEFLRGVHAAVSAMPPAELKRRLKRTRPPLVQMHLPGRSDPSAALLVPVSAERFRNRR